MRNLNKKPKQVSWRKLFYKWDIVIFLIIFTVIFFWIFFFIPDPVIEWISSRIGFAQIIGGKLFTVATSDSIVIIFALFLIGDPLLYGNTKSSLYFRGEFPSNKLTEKLNINPDYASQLFPSYYDCWQYDSELQHEFYLKTTYVHYKCLFVFLLKPLTIILLFLAFLFLLLNIFYLKVEPIVIVGQGLILFFLAVCATIIIYFNRLPSKRRSYPTGCWSEWRDRCMENYMEFMACLGKKSLSDFHNEMRAKHLDLNNRAKS